MMESLVYGFAALVIVLAVASLYFNGWMWQLVLERFFGVTVGSLHRISWLPMLPGVGISLLAVPLVLHAPGASLLVNLVVATMPPVVLHLFVPDSGDERIGLRTAALSYLVLLAVFFVLSLVLALVIGLVFLSFR